MSLINTIALPLFIFFVGICLLIVIGTWAYRAIVKARAKMLIEKRYSRLERDAYQFVGKLYIESNSVTSDVTLSPELTDELFSLVDRIDQNKELTR